MPNINLSWRGCLHSGSACDVPKGSLSDSSLFLVLWNLRAEREVDWRRSDGATAPRMMVVVRVGVWAVTLSFHHQINSREGFEKYSSNAHYTTWLFSCSLPLHDHVNFDLKRWRHDRARDRTITSTNLITSTAQYSALARGSHSPSPSIAGFVSIKRVE